ncbi:MAG: YqeG family HAD IIIA-type phosphatase [Oscillospiraceae bacterium]|nr:YqeG family HAD IIIA-type phosphatase [Oscillospiraceae bacterium]
MLFTPTKAYKCILDVTPQILSEMGVTALILDIDNTMTTHDNPVPIDGMLDWLDNMKSSGIKMIVVSNNHSPRVEPFARMLGLEFVPDGAKPLTKGYKIAALRLNTPRKEICTIGDQLFTDILGAKLFGIKSILVPPIQYEKTVLFKIKRTAEKPFLPKEYKGNHLPMINGKNISEVLK